MIFSVNNFNLYQTIAPSTYQTFGPSSRLVTVDIDSKKIDIKFEL